MKKTGYERQHKNDIYYSTDAAGYALKHFDFHDLSNNDAYTTANYYSDENIAKNNARADKLMRQLRRFAVENNDKEIDWNVVRKTKHCICYDYITKTLYLSIADVLRNFGNIYFSSEEIAKKALTTFHDELIWYFTEYCDHIVYEKDENNVEGCELCKRGCLNSVGIIDDHIRLYGGNSKPNDNEKVKFCPKCGRKLVSDND